jgi:uncharacterized membrane protein
MPTAIPASADLSLHFDVRSVPLLRPFRWLSRGIADCWRCGWASIAHGFLISVLGWMLILILGSHPYFVAAAISGFLLVAPIMTTGLCELSRRCEAGLSLDFDGSLSALARDGGALFRFGGILAAFAVLWFFVSEVLLRTVFHAPGIDFSQSYWRGFLGLTSHRDVYAYVLVGGILAAFVFALSAVSVPLIIDRHVGAREAMAGSLRAVVHNLPAMAVWSVLLVVLTGIGFATFLFGMIVIVPILGHATWHAYRDLIR